MYMAIAVEPTLAATSTRPVFPAVKTLTRSGEFCVLKPSDVARYHRDAHGAERAGVGQLKPSLCQVLTEAVRHGREDHPRLEQEQPLDVQRALVVQEPLRAAEDQL